MKVDIVTIFPKMVEAPLAEGIVARAIARGVMDVRVHDLRAFTTDRHRVVDDVPFGGGPGMVLKPEPLFAAVDRIRDERGAPGAIVLTSPDGGRLTHAVAQRLSALDHVVVLCGRYEGVDERVRQHLATEAISIGDYVLSGGELPALVIVDAVARLIPGAGYRRCCCRGTTRRSRSGGGSRRSNAPAGIGRTCWCGRNGARASESRKAACPPSRQPRVRLLRRGKHVDLGSHASGMERPVSAA